MNIVDPCEKCKRKGSCPSVCYPKKDYLRHIKKENRKAKQERKR